MNRRKKKMLRDEFKKNLETDDIHIRIIKEYPVVAERDKYVLHMMDLMCTPKFTFTDSALDQCAKVIDEAFRFFPNDMDRCVKEIAPLSDMIIELYKTEPQQAFAAIRCMIHMNSTYYPKGSKERKSFPRLSCGVISNFPSEVIGIMAAEVKKSN